MADELSPAAEFRYGFLLACADQGLDAAAAERRAAAVVKSAVFGTLRDGLMLTAGLGGVGLGVAGVTGYGVGRQLGRADNDYAAKEVVEAQEKVDLYNRLAEKLRRQKALRATGGI